MRYFLRSLDRPFRFVSDQGPIILQIICQSWIYFFLVKNIEYRFWAFLPQNEDKGIEGKWKFNSFELKHLQIFSSILKQFAS